MKFTVLGSGCGVPNLKRNAPSNLIEVDNLKLLLDCGPGALRQLLKIGLDYCHIDKILITHLHTDHVADIGPFLFSSKYEFNPRKKNLEIFGPKGIKRFYDKLIKLYDKVLLPERYKVIIKEKGDSNFKIGNLSVKTKRLPHAKETIGYRIKDKRGKTLVYSGDTDYCRGLIELSKDADLLILECSFPDNIKVEGHLTPTLAGKIAKEAKVKRLILTHLYPINNKTEITKTVRRIYKKRFYVASDLLRIII